MAYEDLKFHEARDIVRNRRSNNNFHERINFPTLGETVQKRIIEARKFSEEEQLTANEKWKQINLGLNNSNKKNYSCSYDKIQNIMEDILGVGEEAEIRELLLKRFIRNQNVVDKETNRSAMDAEVNQNQSLREDMEEHSRCEYYPNVSKKYHIT